MLNGALNLAPSVVVSSNSDGTDACGDVEPHGYLGIETAAVGTITSWLDQVLLQLAVKNVIAIDGSFTLTNMSPVTVDLSQLISVPPASSSVPLAALCDFGLGCSDNPGGYEGELRSKRFRIG